MSQPATPKSGISFNFERIFCCNSQTVIKKEVVEEPPKISRESSCESLEVTVEEIE